MLQQGWKETFVVFVVSHLPERGITIEVVKKVRASARKVRDIAQNLSTELSSRDRPTDCTTHNSNNELDFLTLFQVLWTLSSLLQFASTNTYATNLKQLFPSRNNSGIKALNRFRVFLPAWLYVARRDTENHYYLQITAGYALPGSFFFVVLT